MTDDCRELEKRLREEQAAHHQTRQGALAFAELAGQQANALHREIEDALRERDAAREALRDALKCYRGVSLDRACESCGGWGVRLYGSEATWRGGIGGAAMTRDTCDACWGSGDRERAGIDLRTMVAKLCAAREALREACDLFASDGYDLCLPARRQDLARLLA